MRDRCWGSDSADVAGAGRAEHRIDDGVAHHVAIGVAEWSPVGHELDAGQHERTAVDQAVQVVAGAHARRAGRQSRPGRLEIVRLS